MQHENADENENANANANANANNTLYLVMVPRLTRQGRRKRDPEGPDRCQGENQFIWLFAFLVLDQLSESWNGLSSGTLYHLHLTPSSRGENKHKQAQVDTSSTGQRFLEEIVHITMLLIRDFPSIPSSADSIYYPSLSLSITINQFQTLSSMATVQSRGPTITTWLVDATSWIIW